MILLIPDAREEVRSLKYKELREAVLLCDESEVRIILGALGSEQEVIVNMAPAGANTLIFSAAQSGNENIVTLLLEAGADGRAHTVTKYSPLYTAVHNGHRKVTKMLLEKFPELIQVGVWIKLLFLLFLKNFLLLPVCHRGEVATVSCGSD